MKNFDPPVIQAGFFMHDFAHCGRIFIYYHKDFSGQNYMMRWSEL